MIHFENNKRELIVLKKTKKNCTNKSQMSMAVHTVKRVPNAMAIVCASSAAATAAFPNMLRRVVPPLLPPPLLPPPLFPPPLLPPPLLPPGLVAWLALVTGLGWVVATCLLPPPH